jgi:hypothetical protein
MPKPNDHELGIPLTFSDVWGKLLHHLKSSGVPSLDNSTHQYEAFLDGLLTFNISFTKGSRSDNISDYDVLDECSPFLGALDFLHKYILPVIIFAGKSVVFDDRFSLRHFKHIIYNMIDSLNVGDKVTTIIALWHCAVFGTQHHFHLQKIIVTFPRIPCSNVCFDSQIVKTCLPRGVTKNLQCCNFLHKESFVKIKFLAEIITTVITMTDFLTFSSILSSRKMSKLQMLPSSGI